MKIKVYTDGTIRLMARLINGGKIDVGVRGYGRILMMDPDLKVVSDTNWIKNSFTNVGKAWCVNVIGKLEGSYDAMDCLAVGTDNTAEEDTDTTLGAEITGSGLARARDSAPSKFTTTVANDTH